MTTKLSWSFDQTENCEIAYHNGYRIKAEQDTSPENPFENWDGCWPIAAYYDGSTTDYDKTGSLNSPSILGRFNDAQLIHDQTSIADALGTTIRELTCYGYGDKEGPVSYCWDAEFLREAFEQQQEELPVSDWYDAAVKLCVILGIPAMTGTSRGYSQGDWAEVLVVATPEAQEKFGCTIESRRRQALEELMKLDVKTDATTDVVNAQAKLLWDKDLQGTIDLYSAWAWGDVFGYVIEKPVFDEDGEIEEWVDACDHNSCWGYYGSDHDESGLEDAALESVPDEVIVWPEAAREAA